MKKKRIYLLFLLLISIFVLNSMTVMAAQENGKTEGQIGFIDGGKKKPNKPKDPKDPRNPKKKNNGLLPKTGEVVLRYITIIGTISLVATVIIVLIKRRNKQGFS
ncbi:LPXTG cell wall anchor domain-containing protein [Enterococcus sp. AZ192]|uniref:LPXTG cell wall anchor domain-containing protein n=1 Tax=unclassified Enterococcus TaxID=2608891 RepID=UPI003D2B7220